MAVKVDKKYKVINLSGDSYFISLSDLLVGLLFIFIIILMSFSLNLKTAEDELKSAEDELTNTRELKQQLLLEMEKTLKDEGVEVSIDINNGILHLPESILFNSGSAQLKGEGKKNIAILAKTLYALLPCYSEHYIENYEKQCAKNLGGKSRLDTVFIEGHTDDVKIGKHLPFIKDNWQLSSERAINTYKMIIDVEKGLDDIRNSSSESILSVSAYESRRPRKGNGQISIEEQRAKNRRIDLRFLMVAPKKKEAKKLEDIPKELELLLND